MELIGAGKAARLIGITTTTLYAWEKRGLIQSVRTATGIKKWLVEEVERLVPRPETEVKGMDDAG